MNEQDLILALQRGDESAFAELIARHEKKVYNLCLRMLANEHEAEEAAQDAFLPCPVAEHRRFPRREQPVHLALPSCLQCLHRSDAQKPPRSKQRFH